MRPIPTTVHGVLDYLTVGALLALPRILRWPGYIVKLLTGMAATIFGYSLLTNYEFGLFRRLSMLTHLRLDAFAAVATLIAAWMCRRQNRTASRLLAGMGLFEMTAATLTDPRPYADQFDFEQGMAYMPEAREHM